MTVRRAAGRDHLEEPTVYVNRLSRAVDATIATRKKTGIDLHISKSGWARAKIQKFGLSVVDALSTALTIKDEVIDKHMREVRLYRGDQYIADRIREPLERELREAWSAGKRVIVIGHSMGTFIAYDVLWRFSHRSEKIYHDFRRKKVDLMDYTRLYNPYLNTQGKQNPHKSYGYLVQPKLSQNLRRFFGVP